MLLSWIKKHRWLIFSLLITLPTVFYLLKPGYFNMHDDLQMMRLLQMEKCIKDAQIPCRWVPDMGYGYGYPLFNFYPPLPFYLGLIPRLLGISFVWSTKLLFVFQHLASGLAMYLFASAIFGPVSGFLATAFYSWAPYHALDTYVRGALNESFAFIFFPLLFLYSYKLIKEKRKIRPLLFLSLSFAGLMLSHSIMVLMIVPFLALWVLFLLLTEKKLFLPDLKTIRLPQTTGLKSFLFPLFGWVSDINFSLIFKFLLSGLLAIGLASFFFFPVIFENKYVQLDSMFRGYYSYIVHFTSINQLFISRFWGYGASVWGQEDQMSFQVGHLHWMVSLPIAFFALRRFFKTKKPKIKKETIFVLFFISMAFFGAFLTHERSTFMWNFLPLLQKAQFSWRFLTVATFFFSLSVVYLPGLISKLKPSLRKNIYLSLLIILLALNFSYFRPGQFGPITDEQKFSGRAWMLQQTAGIYDYLPRWASTAAKGKAGDLIDEIEGEVDITNKQKGTDWFSFDALVKNNEAKITLAQHYFPNFKIYNGDQELVFDIEPELGRMTFELAPGEYKIRTKLENTPVRSASNLITLFSLALTAYLFYKTCPKRKQ